jgi:hypothetical protein
MQLEIATHGMNVGLRTLTNQDIGVWHFGVYHESERRGSVSDAGFPHVGGRHNKACQIVGP